MNSQERRVKRWEKFAKIGSWHDPKGT